MYRLINTKLFQWSLNMYKAIYEEEPYKGLCVALILFFLTVALSSGVSGGLGALFSVVMTIVFILLPMFANIFWDKYKDSDN